MVVPDRDGGPSAMLYAHCVIVTTAPGSRGSLRACGVEMKRAIAHPSMRSRKWLEGPMRKESRTLLGALT